MFKKIFFLLLFSLLFLTYSFSEIISLDGEWDIIFDESNESKNKSLYLESNFKKNNSKRNKTLHINEVHFDEAFSIDANSIHSR